MQLARATAAVSTKAAQEKERKKQAPHPSIRDRHVIYKHSNVTRREENVRRIYGSDVVSNSSRRAKQTCKSALTVIERDNDNSVLLSGKHRRNIFSYKLPLSAFI